MIVVFGMISPAIAVVVLILALIIFGPGKLPSVGKSLGRGLKEFKEATNDVQDIVNTTVQTVDPNPAQSQSPTQSLTPDQTKDQN